MRAETKGELIMCRVNRAKSHWLDFKDIKQNLSWLSINRER